MFRNCEYLVSVEPDSRVIRECGSNITEVRTECYNLVMESLHISKFVNMILAIVTVSKVITSHVTFSLLFC